MVEPLENLYFNWLCAKVIDIRNNTPSTTYWTLLRTLHSTEFVWIVPNDHNRAGDGIELRYYFVNETGIEDDKEWRRFNGCSMLEMLIAFSMRTEFDSLDDETAKEWFWEFIDNLGLKEANDASGWTPEEIGQVLYNFIWRTYEPNGKGGIFPMDDPKYDQREVELWYQHSQYLVDHGRL